MPDFELLFSVAGRAGLICVYLYLCWGLTRDFWAWFWLLGFLGLPPDLQVLALACLHLWALKSDREARARQTTDIKSTASFFGPRPVP